MESEVSMKNLKLCVEKDFDDTKIVDAVCKLKSYLNIIDVYIEHYVMNEELSDLGVVIENIADIVHELENEYMPRQ